jgi:hypothetical protein
MTPRICLAVLALSSVSSGCAVIAIADAVVSTTVSVAGTVVSTTASVVGAGVKAVAGSSDEPKEKK